LRHSVSIALLPLGQRKIYARVIGSDPAVWQAQVLRPHLI
jgi:hypothetical protein